MVDSVHKLFNLEIYYVGALTTNPSYLVKLGPEHSHFNANQT